MSIRPEYYNWFTFWIFRWLTKDWWIYLLGGLRNDWGNKITKNRYHKLSWQDTFARLICRIKGHPCGQVYYNPNGYEPDYHCKNCGDEI